MNDRDRLPAGIYLSPRHDDMVVMVDAGGFPRPVSEDYNTLISHNGQPDHLAKLWGPLTPAKVVPADAIVIPRDELPEVTPRSDGSALRVIETGHGPLSIADPHIGADTYRRRALAALAIAEHLDQNPPVDEAQVGALAKAIRDQGEYLDETVLARRLVAAGVRAPQAGDDQ